MVIPRPEYIYFGSRLLATYDGSTLKYHHADDLSVRLTTDTNGSVVASQGHYPYGESWYQGSGSTKFQFTSYERDAESGLDYFGARYYASLSGRFMSADLPFIGQSLADPQTLNLYAYVRNNPLVFVDPTGHYIEGALHGPTTRHVEGGSALSGVGGGGSLIEALAIDLFGLPVCDLCGGESVFAEQARKASNPQKSVQQAAQQQAQQQITPNYKPAGGNETVAEIAGRINHETLGMKDSPTENESLASAQEKIAHARLNGIRKWGNQVDKHAILATPVMGGPGYKAALLAVENAVRQDLNGVDPTHGSIQYNMRTLPQVQAGHKFWGQSVHTVSGPYISPTKHNYIVTYGPGP